MFNVRNTIQIVYETTIYLYKNSRFSAPSSSLKFDTGNLKNDTKHEKGD